MSLSRWPESFASKKRGDGCPHCLVGRVDETEHGVRFFDGSISDGYLQRVAPTPGYCVVVFRGRHVGDLHELTADEHALFWSEIGSIAKAIYEVFAPVHLNFQVLGNHDPHVHCHVVARYDPDPAPSMPLPEAAWRASQPVPEGEFADQLDRMRRWFPGGSAAKRSDGDSTAR